MPEAGGEADGGLLGGDSQESWGKVGPRAPLPAEGAGLSLSQ